MRQSGHSEGPLPSFGQLDRRERSRPGRKEKENEPERDLIDAPSAGEEGSPPTPVGGIHGALGFLRTSRMFLGIETCAKTTGIRAREV